MSAVSKETITHAYARPERREAFYIVRVDRTERGLQLTGDITWQPSYMQAVQYADALPCQLVFCVPATAFDSIANYKREIAQYLRHLRQTFHTENDK